MYKTVCVIELIAKELCARVSYGTYRVSASVTGVQVVFSYTVSIFCRSEAGSRSDAPTTKQPTPSPATLALVKMCEMLGGRGVCVSVLSRVHTKK